MLLFFLILIPTVDLENNLKFQFKGDETKYIFKSYPKLAIKNLMVIALAIFSTTITVVDSNY